MSQENVEIVRRIYEAWSTGDFRAGVDELDRLAMFVVGPEFPESGVFIGPEGVRDYMRIDILRDKSEALAAVGLSE